MKKVFLLILVSLVLFSAAAVKSDWKVGVSADYLQKIENYWQNPNIPANSPKKALYDVAVSLYAEKEFGENQIVYAKLGCDVVGASYKFDKTRTSNLKEFFTVPFPVYLAVGTDYYFTTYKNFPISYGFDLSIYKYDGITPKTTEWNYPQGIGRFMTASVTLSTKYDFTFKGYDFELFAKALLGYRAGTNLNTETEKVEGIMKPVLTGSMGLVYKF